MPYVVRLRLRRLLEAKREGDGLENESTRLNRIIEARRQTLQEQVVLLAGLDQ